jgi:hypothetical protein
MTKLTKAALTVITIAGSIFPFVDRLVFQAFYLLIPLVVTFLGCVVFIASLVKRSSAPRALLITSLIPIFFGSQVLSVVVVYFVQRTRSEALIKDLENALKEGRPVPEDHQTPMGIRLENEKNSNTYKIAYSRGFMVTEIYESASKTWRSHGWND